MSKRKYPQETLDRIIELSLKGLSSRRICDELGWKRSKKSGINRVLTDFRSGKVEYSKEVDDMEEDWFIEDVTLDSLCESEDFNLSNLAKRLRTAQRSNNQLRKIQRQTLDPVLQLDDVLKGITKAVTTQEIKTEKLATFKENPSSQNAIVEVLFSDFQIGKVGQYYNTDLAKRAISKYGKEVVKNISERSGKYKYDKIVLAMLGDLLEDHLKHGVQSAMATDSGLSEQISNATLLIWNHVIKPLAKLGIPMEVICIAGNHGSSQHKGMDMYKAGLFSYDYPIYKTQEALCKEAGLNHVNFIIPEGVFGYTDFYGNWAVYEHGYFNSATEKSMEDQMKKRGQQMKRHVEYFRCGDMHHLCSYDCHKLVLNGAFFGTDTDGVEYSGIIGFNSVPAQAMMFHTPEKSLGRNTVKEFITIQVADGY